MTELLKYNLNEYVLVKIKDAGIEKYVKDHNEILPFQLHISFKEFKEKADKNGYHKMQLWSLFDAFGGLGMRLCNYIETDIILDYDHLKAVEF